MLLQVKFTKIGHKIKFELPVKMFCEKMQKELPNSFTFDKTDLIFNSWKINVDKAFKTSNVIFKKVDINQIYDECDKPIKQKQK